MTVLVLLIALLHGIPVVLARVIWRSRLVATLAAILMAAVGVALGGPMYGAVDVVVVFVVWFLCMKGGATATSRDLTSVANKQALRNPAKIRRHYGGR